jgi:deoxyribonuclease-4
MLPPGPRLGIHLAHATGLVKAADRAAKLGLEAVQVFGDNPTAWRRRAEPSPELPAFRARLASVAIEPVVVHASYLVNPAGPAGPNRERSIELLASELVHAPGFGASLVNVHVGSHGGAGVESGIASLVEVVVRARELADAMPAGGPELDGDADRTGDADPAGDARPAILLENSAGGGFALGTDLDELAAIAAALDATGIARSDVGFCLDTAHAWGAGIDLSDPDAIDSFLAGFDARIGLDRLRLVHLNDSASALGSRSDRHQHLGAGRIGAVGLGHLLRDPRLAGLPVILETPGMEEGYDAVNVERARALLRSERLAELPPEAFQLRGSRARAAAPPIMRGGEPATQPAVEPEPSTRRRAAVGCPSA